MQVVHPWICESAIYIKYKRKTEEGKGRDERGEVKGLSPRTNQHRETCDTRYIAGYSVESQSIGWP